MTANTRFSKIVTPYLLKIPGLLERKYRGISNEFFDHNAFGLQPKHSVFAQHPTLSDDLPSRILHGRVVVKPDIKRFTKTGIEWADGTVTEPVDNVVFSTGYKFSFPLIEVSEPWDVGIPPEFYVAPCTEVLPGRSTRPLDNLRSGTISVCSITCEDGGRNVNFMAGGFRFRTEKMTSIKCCFFARNEEIFSFFQINIEFTPI